MEVQDGTLRSQRLIVELRCPIGPQRLLSKLVLARETPRIVPGNLIELACSDCKQTQRRRDPSVVRVLHRFNLVGELVESEVVRLGR